MLRTGGVIASLSLTHIFYCTEINNRQQCAFIYLINHLHRTHIEFETGWFNTFSSYNFDACNGKHSNAVAVFVEMCWLKRVPNRLIFKTERKQHNNGSFDSIECRHNRVQCMKMIRRSHALTHLFRWVSERIGAIVLVSNTFLLISSIIQFILDGMNLSTRNTRSKYAVIRPFLIVSSLILINSCGT